MYKFPENLYTDIRIDNYSETQLTYDVEVLAEIKEKDVEGIFLRIYDGHRWYYSSFTGKENIQTEIDVLAEKATPNPNVYDSPIIKKLEANQYRKLSYEDGFQNLSLDEKIAVVSKYPKQYVSQCSLMTDLTTQLLLIHNVREFYSSKGANLYYDEEVLSLVLSGTFACGENVLVENYEKFGHRLSDLDESVDREITEHIQKAEEFVRECVSVEPGAYPVVFSPENTGLLCHESVGHKSEGDFFVDSPGMEKIWNMGEEFCDRGISIVDDGEIESSIYLPFDDEGTRSRPTAIVKEGCVGDRMTNAAAAAELNLPMTGNARAIDYTWEPMVRMTTVYLNPRTMHMEDIFKGIEKGIFADTYIAGGGMDVFSIAPGRCYLIENGKITKPVAVSLIFSRCKDALAAIEGRTAEVILKPAYYIRCGKPPQLGLATSDGGPYVRFKSMSVV